MPEGSEGGGEGEGEEEEEEGGEVVMTMDEVKESVAGGNQWVIVEGKVSPWRPSKEASGLPP